MLPYSPQYILENTCLYNCKVSRLHNLQNQHLNAFTAIRKAELASLYKSALL